MATTENMGGPATVSYSGPSLVTQQHTYGHVYVSNAGHALTLFKKAILGSSLLSFVLVSCRLCCLCGTSIMSNPSNMCVNCIRSQVDITAPIQKQVTVLWCKECNRYLQPPKNWVRAELESKELLTFCVKRIKGLQKVCLSANSILQ